MACLHAGGRIHTHDGESHVSRLCSQLHCAGGRARSTTKIKKANERCRACGLRPQQPPGHRRPPAGERGSQAERHHEVIAGRDLVESRCDVLSRDHVHRHARAELVEAPRGQAQEASRSGAHLQHADQPPRRRPAIHPPPPQQDSERDHGNPNPKSSIGMSHGARSPRISSGL